MGQIFVAYLNTNVMNLLPASTAFKASNVNLRRLAMIRLIFITALLIVMGYTYQVTESDFVHPVYLVVLAVLALTIVLTYWRLLRTWPVTDLEYFCQLLIDIIGLTILFYISGGATNPFVSFYLVPLTISAALLPWRFTWIIAGLTLSAYSAMLLFNQPVADLQSHHHHGMQTDSNFNLHILGMWFTFALSTVLITYFVVRMASALRQQEQVLTSNREDELRNEQILAVATLAAGTAHELGTPLSTMSVLLDELQQEYPQEENLSKDLQLLTQQVKSCKKILQGLVSTAEIKNDYQQNTESLIDYIENLLDRWQVIRPEAQPELTIDPSCNDKLLTTDPTLEQAICNLLNNAADSSPDNRLTVVLNCDNKGMLLSIRDFGAGIPMEIAEQIGKPFISTKGDKGLGLGLFLSHATVNRYNGSISLFNHPESGTVAELRLPLAKLDDHA